MSTSEGVSPVSVIDRAEAPPIQEEATTHGNFIPGQISFRVTAAVAVLPITISAIRNGLDGWYPTWDAAHTAVRVNDVFTGHFPLLGMAAAPSFGSSAHYSFPGAIELYLLALPVELLGVSWGLLVGMAIINTAFALGALWMIRRRVGYRIGIVGCVFFATLLWSIGSQVMIDPTPIRIGVIPFFTLLVAGWSVADGDAKALPIFAVSANYLLLSQLKFSLAVPVVVLYSLIMLWRYLASCRGRDDAHWDSIRRAHSKAGGAALAITAAMWSVPIFQQFTADHGNIGALFDALLGSSSGQSGSSGAHVSNLAGAIGTVTSVVAVPRFWLRPTFLEPGFDTDGGGQSFLLRAVCLAVFITFVALAAHLARRRGDRTVLVALGMVVASFASWVVSGLLNPSPHGFLPGYFHSVWSVSAFTWMILAIAALRSFPIARDAFRLWPVTVGAFTFTVLVAWLTLPHANHGASTEDGTVTIARGIQQAVVPVAKANQPVIVHSDAATRRYVADVYLVLQEQGIPFRVDSSYYEQLFGAERAYRPELGNAASIIALSNLGTPPGNYLPIASVPTPDPEPQDFAEVSRRMRTWASSIARTGGTTGLDRTPGDRTEEMIRFDTHLGTTIADGDDPLADEELLEQLDHAGRGPADLVADATGLESRQVQDWAEYQLKRLTGRVVYLYWRPLDQ